MTEYFKIKNLLFFLIILLPNTSQAEKIEKVKVFTTDGIIPLIKITNRQLSGLSGEFLVQSTKDVINHLELEILPWPRAQNEVQKEKNAIILPLTRTAPRENKYKWIAKVFDDKVCFFTLKKHNSINNINDILALKSIGIARGGAEESIIKELSITDTDKIAYSNSPQFLILKLFAGRLDSFLLGSLSANYIWRNNNYPLEQLQCGIPYTYNIHFIAASLKSDNKFIKTISTAMEKFKKTHAYFKLLKKYGINDVNKMKTIKEEIMN